ncbi:hypothetical protein EYF80_037269 [Liparis tanakae]|uniref:Uncharacterized protein n=1 Tax=Liparis tanakae TaxID=230148 RepID=A0A4Z2GIH6_9TELE|nr:hypothetical protein EYF80_037269 [Liparis tanakae]
MREECVVLCASVRRAALKTSEKEEEEEEEKEEEEEEGGRAEGGVTPPETGCSERPMARVHAAQSGRDREEKGRAIAPPAATPAGSLSWCRCAAVRTATAAVPNDRLRWALQFHARGERAGFVLHLLECHNAAVMV